MPSGQAAGSTLEQELNRLSLASGPDELIAAFEADADQKKRAVATLALSKGASDQEQLASLYAPLARRFHDESSSKAYASALRCLSTLANLAPAAAQAILFAEAGSKPLWTSAFPKVGDPDPLLDILRADLLATLANDGASRATVLKEAGLMAWLRAAAPTTASDDRIALVAHLALYKLQQRSSSSQEGIPAAEQPQRDSKGDEALYRLAKAQILAANTETLNEEQSRIALLAGLEGLSYLSSSSSAFKDLIANEAPFLQALCRLPSSLGQQKGRRAVFPSRGQAASGASSSYQLDSAIGTDGVTPADTSVQYALSTIILNLVAYPPVLSGEEKQMEKLRAMASAKQQQQQQQQGQASGKHEANEPTSKVDARVIKAIDAGVVDTLVSIALSGVDSTGATGLNASTAVRDAISTAFIHLTVRQDKQQRGRIAQAGGTKALVALSSDVLARLKQRAQPTPAVDGASMAVPASKSPPPPPLSALQSLARLCITTSPALLFGGSDSSSSSMAAVTSTLLPFFCVLYLDASSDPLQRFEALLALTNLASLSPLAARAVATSKVSVTAGGKREEKKAGQKEEQRPSTILDGLEDSIFLSSNDMIRRAAVELLCNLVQDELAFARWSGEEGKEEAQKKKKATKASEGEANDDAASRAQHRLHLLVALCAPAAGGAETSLPTRMAASGALASLCSSPVACAHALALRAKTVNIIARLVRPGVAVKASGSQQQEAKIVELKDDDNDEANKAVSGEDEDAVDEEEEARLELQDAQSWPQGASHARASLAIRGVTIASCLVQYVAWRRGRGGAEAEEKKLQQSGLLEALKQAALEGAREMQQQRNTVTSGGREGAIVQEVRAMRGEVTKISLEALKEVSRWGKTS